MLCGDARLGVVPGEHVALRRAGEPTQPDLDCLLVPERPVLLLEQQEAPAAVLSRWHAGAMQVHERQQGERLRRCAQRMLGEDRRQPSRLVAELATNRALCVRRQIAFREQQVEDGLDGREPRRELLVREIHELERRLSEASSCATEPLVDVGFRREQALGDLADVEAAQCLEREDELRLDGDCVVAAGEQHAKEVVADISREERGRCVVRRVQRGAGVLFCELAVADLSA